MESPAENVQDLVTRLTTHFNHTDLSATEKSALRKLVIPPISGDRKEKQAASRNARNAVRYKEDETYREKVLERTRQVFNNRYHNDEEFREKCKARARENYKARKAQASADATAIVDALCTS